MEPFSFPTSQEPFVGAERAAAFLALSRKNASCALSQRAVARASNRPNAPRKIWRFRLSELSRWLDQEA
jgi:hypothetical protein